MTPEEIARAVAYDWKNHALIRVDVVAIAISAAEERGRVNGLEEAQKSLRAHYTLDTGCCVEALDRARAAIERLKEKPCDQQPK